MKPIMRALVIAGASVVVLLLGGYLAVAFYYAAHPPFVVPEATKMKDVGAANNREADQ